MRKILCKIPFLATVVLAAAYLTSCSIVPVSMTHDIEKPFEEGTSFLIIRDAGTPELEIALARELRKAGYQVVGRNTINNPLPQGQISVTTTDSNFTQFRQETVETQLFELGEYDYVLRYKTNGGSNYWNGDAQISRALVTIVDPKTGMVAGTIQRNGDTRKYFLSKVAVDITYAIRGVQVVR
ncbi:MAG: hypothetical protein AAF741_01045 [Bacteroidota bacterium]